MVVFSVPIDSADGVASTLCRAPAYGRSPRATVGDAIGDDLRLAAADPFDVLDDLLSRLAALLTALATERVTSCSGLVRSTCSCILESIRWVSLFASGR